MMTKKKDQNNHNDEPEDGTDGQNGNDPKPPEGAQNTDGMIPKSRFDETNDRMKAAEKRVAELEAKEAERQQQEAIERGEFDKILAELEPKAKRADAYEAALQAQLDAALEDVPEDWRDLVPEGDVISQLEWMRNARAKGVFDQRRAPDMHAGEQGDKKKAAKLDDGERSMASKFGLSEDRFAKARDEGQ